MHTGALAKPRTGAAQVWSSCAPDRRWRIPNPLSRAAECDAVCLLGGRLDGGREEHLRLLGGASGLDFVSLEGLEAECDYTWRSVLAGGLPRSQ